jgi:FkbM family methyltransferase
MRIEQINGHSVVVDWISSEAAVLDLGANVGTFSKEAHGRFGCSTTAVEPNTDLHGYLETPAISHLHATLVTLDGRDVTFSISENSECSTILHTHQSPVVETRTLLSTPFDELLPRNTAGRVDWVKMDIEGVEIEILNGCPKDVLLGIDQLSVEFHESNGLTDVRVVEECIERLKGFGFCVFRGSLKDYSDVLFINPRRDLPLGWPLTSRYWRFTNGLRRVVRRIADRSPQHR